MAYQRCIMCKQVEDKKEFMRQFYCNSCWKNNSTNKLDHYYISFSWELFQLEYPNSWEDCFPIRREYDKKILYNTGKEKLEALIVEKNELKKFYEDNDNTSGEFYKETVAEVERIQEQFARILYHKPKN